MHCHQKGTLVVTSEGRSVRHASTAGPFFLALKGRRTVLSTSGM